MITRERLLVVGQEYRPPFYGHVSMFGMEDHLISPLFTNPVWVKVGERPVRSRAAADDAIQWIDRLREMAEAWPEWRSRKERDQVFSQFDEAKTIHCGFADEADR